MPFSNTKLDQFGNIKTEMFPPLGAKMLLSRHDLIDSESYSVILMTERGMIIDNVLVPTREAAEEAYNIMRGKLLLRLYEWPEFLDDPIFDWNSKAQAGGYHWRQQILELYPNSSPLLNALGKSIKTS